MNKAIALHKSLIKIYKLKSYIKIKHIRIDKIDKNEILSVFIKNNNQLKKKIEKKDLIENDGIFFLIKINSKNSKIKKITPILNIKKKRFNELNKFNIENEIKLIKYKIDKDFVIKYKKEKVRETIKYNNELELNYFEHEIGSLNLELSNKKRRIGLDDIILNLLILGEKEIDNRI